mmetsp:Transcript_11771/g.27937  ORF Transcript_11771/g.27937 Transcript_11771/m.27937 type:complete len:99 (+) Transcript_11771:137-433(+)
MSRGNQRDTDRAKRQAKEAAKNKQNGREGTPAQRNGEDGAKLQAKLAAKASKKAEDAENATTTKAPVVRKKVPAKKTDTLDDMLNAGLSAKKSKNRKK